MYCNFVIVNTRMSLEIGLTNECSKLFLKVKEDIQIVAQSSCFVGHPVFYFLLWQTNEQKKICQK